MRTHYHVEMVEHGQHDLKDARGRGKTMITLVCSDHNMQ